MKKFRNELCKLNASSDYDDLDDHESEDYIRQELARISIQVLKNQYVDCSGS